MVQIIYIQLPILVNCGNMIYCRYDRLVCSSRPYTKSRQSHSRPESRILAERYQIPLLSSTVCCAMCSRTRHSLSWLCYQALPYWHTLTSECLLFFYPVRWRAEAPYAFRNRYLLAIWRSCTVGNGRDRNKSTIYELINKRAKYERTQNQQHLI